MGKEEVGDAEAAEVNRTQGMGVCLLHVHGEGTTRAGVGQGEPSWGRHRGCCLVCKLYPGALREAGCARGEQKCTQMKEDGRAGTRGCASSVGEMKAGHGLEHARVAWCVGPDLAIGPGGYAGSSTGLGMHCWAY